MASFRIMGKIYTVMTDAAPGRAGILPVFLRLASMLYGVGMRIRSLGYDQGIITAQKLPCRVISVGNITVGGTGKTPMTIRIAQLAGNMGFRPAILSRGYKGGLEKRGGIVSDQTRVLIGPAMAGDEPYMMARQLPGVPVLVGADRVRMGHAAIETFASNLIVLDDGFQHRRLTRDLDLVLVDDRTFFGNGRLLPRGLLREPATALGRAHAVILTRCDPAHSLSFSRLAAMVPGKPLFTSRHAPYIDGIYNGKDAGPEKRHEPMIDDFSVLHDAGVFVFSGIAQNGEFLRMISEKAKSVKGAMAFPDHHPYTDAQCDDIVRRAQRLSADYLVTTEKDYIRVMGRLQTAIPLVVAGVRIDFGPDAERFADFLKNRLAGEGYEADKRR
jgi:tetraacyldisaccharide 4'-kinase